MPRKAAELNALAVQRLVKPGMHLVGVIPGLALQVLPSGGRTWVLRMKVCSKRRDMGLGGYPAVTLTDTRKTARKARDLVRQGIDRIEQGRQARSASNDVVPSRSRPVTLLQMCITWLYRSTCMTSLS